MMYRDWLSLYKESAFVVMIILIVWAEKGISSLLSDTGLRDGHSSEMIGQPISLCHHRGGLGSEWMHVHPVHPSSQLLFCLVF